MQTQMPSYRRPDTVRQPKVFMSRVPTDVKLISQHEIHSSAFLSSLAFIRSPFKQPSQFSQEPITEVRVVGSSNSICFREHNHSVLYDKGKAVGLLTGRHDPVKDSYYWRSLHGRKSLWHRMRKDYGI